MNCQHRWEPLELKSYNRNRYRYKCTRCGNIITTLLKEPK